MASINKQRSITANMVELKVNGMRIGMAQNFRAQTGFGTQGVYEIGSIMPNEHVQLRYEGSFTMEQFLMKEEDIVGAGLIGLGEDILQKEIIDIEVYDKVHEKTLYVYRGCTFTNYDPNIQANAIAGSNVSGQYLSCDQGE